MGLIMSNLVNHAMAEFRAAGWVDEDGNFNDEMQHAICDNVIELLTIFGEQGHSGSSAPYAIELFTNLAKFKPLVPLTGEDWEWNDVSEYHPGKPSLQNNRCSHVFKDENGAYDINGKVFWEWCQPWEEGGEPYKSYYTCRESRVPVTFPYTPKTEYVYRHSDADPQQPAQNEEGFL
jgi:hypothetical protein